MGVYNVRIMDVLHSLIINLFKKCDTSLYIVMFLRCLHDKAMDLKTSMNMLSIFLGVSASGYVVILLLHLYTFVKICRYLFYLIRPTDPIFLYKKS